jgi:hypothetical protein
MDKMTMIIDKKGSVWNIGTMCGGKSYGLIQIYIPSIQNFYFWILVLLKILRKNSYI